MPPCRLERKNIVLSLMLTGPNYAEDLTSSRSAFTTLYSNYRWYKMSCGEGQKSSSKPETPRYVKWCSGATTMLCTLTLSGAV